MVRGRYESSPGMCEMKPTVIEKKKKSYDLNETTPSAGNKKDEEEENEEEHSEMLLNNGPTSTEMKTIKARRFQKGNTLEKKRSCSFSQNRAKSSPTTWLGQER